MSLYSLTHLTGRKRNADRKIIIATVETSKAGFIVSIVAIGVSVLPTAIAVMIFGPAAMVVIPPIFAVAGLILFRSRSQKGLHLPLYRTLLDRGAAKRAKGQILVCGVPIETNAVMSKLMYSSEDATYQPAKTTLDPAKAPVFGTRTKTTAPRNAENSGLWD